MRGTRGISGISGISVISLLFHAVRSAAVHEWTHLELKPNVWVRAHIVSSDDTLPLYVFVTGGMGTPLMTYWHEPALKLSKHFTVLAAEQRGIDGLNNTPPSASVSEHIEDILLLVSYARTRFRQEKVFMGSLSFGSNMVFNISRQYPELLHAVSLTAPMFYFDDLIETHRQDSYNLCKVVTERVPWFVSPLRWLLRECKLPEESSESSEGERDRAGEHVEQVENIEIGYWRDFFLVLQLAVVECVIVKCDDWPRMTWKTPSVFKMLVEPWYGVTGTAAIGWSNANAIITHNHLKDIHMTVTSDEALQVPVQMIVAREDVVATPPVMEHAFAQIRAPRKRLDWVESSGHLIIHDRCDEWVRLNVELGEWLLGTDGGRAGTSQATATSDRDECDASR